MCNECRDKLVAETRLLLDVVNSNVSKDTRDLASDILYGALCELYDVEEDEDDEEEDVVRTNVGDDGSTTLTISSLSDLFKYMSSHTQD